MENLKFIFASAVLLACEFAHAEFFLTDADCKKRLDERAKRAASNSEWKSKRIDGIEWWYEPSEQKEFKTRRVKGVEERYEVVTDCVIIREIIPIRNVTAVVVPEKISGKPVTAIRARFDLCCNMTSLKIPSGLSAIAGYAFGVLGSCAKLSSITVDSKNEHFTSVSGVLFSKDKSLLLAYPAAKSDAHYSIPNGVTSIADWAFSRHPKLKSITIPKSVADTDLHNICGLDHFKSIEVDKAHPRFVSVDGVVFTKDKTAIEIFPQLKTGTYKVPASVKVVELKRIYPAYGNFGIKKLIVPACVEIDSKSFYDAMGGRDKAYEFFRTIGNPLPEIVDEHSNDRKVFPSIKMQQKIVDRMKQIRLPSISIRPPATIFDAVEYIRAMSKDFDNPSIPIEQRGINFVVKVPKTASAPIGQAISASDISLYDAAMLVFEACGCKMVVKGSEVLVMEKNATAD